MSVSGGCVKRRFDGPKRPVANTRRFGCPIDGENALHFSAGPVMLARLHSLNEQPGWLPGFLEPHDPMTKRTSISFQSANSIWPTVEKWAAENGYKPVAQEGDGRTFQKGVGFLVAPMMLRLAQNGDAVTGETWIRAGLFVRIMALFLLPAEMGIESGGFKGVLPRKIARSAVNKLLAELGAPPIG